MNSVALLGSDLVSITLPDGSKRDFPGPISILEVAESIGKGLAKACLGGIVDEDTEISDLRRVLSHSCRLEIITSKSPRGLEVIRHSCAHLLAQAVQELFSGVKVTIGPVIEDGFYYDFDSPQPFSEDDLPKIEERMRAILKRDLPLEREVLTPKAAIDTFAKLGENYKVEIIEALDPSVEVSVYRQGDWFDLCRGPHVRRTKEIGAFKLLSVASSFWRGDEKGPRLQRIYGTAFFDQKDLEAHLQMLEEAKRRDHRKLGKELGLFHFHDYAPGMPFFTSKGTIVYNELLALIRELYTDFGYEEVITPQVFDVELYKRSGHFDNYKENMYFTTVDEREFSLKPMNCPGHCLHYQNRKFSYRDLPYRVADFGRLHRSERSGSVHGLARVRSFCQDDAHIFCSEDQMFSEIEGVMRFLGVVYRALGMQEYKVFLSTRPEQRLGSDEIWDQAESALAKALESLKIPYKINPGDGAFYGPKLDIMFVDALKREWQLGTLQLDFNLPERFQLQFVGEDNSPHRPVMIHRAILGSFERFIGVYLEHVAGHFPFWLAPEQVRVLNVTDRVGGYCEEITKGLMDLGVRAQFDSRNEKLSYKIREAQSLKIPVMLIVGDQEGSKRTVSVRLSTGETLSGLPLDLAIQTLAEFKDKRLSGAVQFQSQTEIKEDHH